MSENDRRILCDTVILISLFIIFHNGVVQDLNKNTIFMFSHLDMLPNMVYYDSWKVLENQLYQSGNSTSAGNIPSDMVSDLVWYAVSGLSAMVGALITFSITAIGAFVANFAWNKFNVPNLTLVSPAVQTKQMRDGAIRQRFEIKNTGRSKANNCNAIIELFGSYPNEEGKYVYSYFPAGWVRAIDQTQESKLGELKSECNIGRNESTLVDIGKIDIVEGTQYMTFEDLTSEEDIVAVKITQDADQDIVDRVKREAVLLPRDTDFIDGVETKNRFTIKELQNMCWCKCEIYLECQNGCTKTYELTFEEPSNDQAPAIRAEPD
ncbi:hypothetical protein [Haloarcula hispanica pleomorphic virus 4]|uniref:Uncharacterized protein n=1 Tax=Haloarcula hispanica pleomorphic virus 4 TaxID=1980140 RepID=A0A2P0QEH7_9VIRU|nr:hypothetical protein HOS97_gp17 [Haloarcula hispanica pleomorphic virus 4]ARM71131.1 hypothetical protein [Haloarcula hispanica pleomorphic virus 4]